MGKILDTLRRAAAGSAADREVPHAEPVPFIEVGPRRGELTASPDVLAAAAPLPGPRAPLVQSPAAEPPPSPLAAELVCHHAPTSAAAARYEALLGDMKTALGGQLAGALLLTAPRSQVGLTTVLLNLAVAAARQGRRVAVVDANFRRPAVAVRLGIDAEPGLTDVLAGDRSLAAALRPTAQAGLSALAAGSPTPLLACPETLRGVLGELAELFDVVLVDGPRWDSRPALAALAAACHAVFLVVPTAAGPGDLLRLMPQQGIRLAGCILTGP